MKITWTVWYVFWATPQHIPLLLFATTPPIQQDSMLEGSGPSLRLYGANMRFTCVRVVTLEICQHTHKRRLNTGNSYAMGKEAFIGACVYLSENPSWFNCDFWAVLSNFAIAPRVSKFQKDWVCDGLQSTETSPEIRHAWKQHFVAHMDRLL